jgi:hypothetical protein
MALCVGRRPLNSFRCSVAPPERDKHSILIFRGPYAHPRGIRGTQRRHPSGARLLIRVGDALAPVKVQRERDRVGEVCGRYGLGAVVGEAAGELVVAGARGASVWLCGRSTANKITTTMSAAIAYQRLSDKKFIATSRILTLANSRPRCRRRSHLLQIGWRQRAGICAISVD